MQLIHLVLHQCDERRNDHRQAIADQRGELVTKALSCAGWENGHGVSTMERGLHDFPLQGPEFIVAEGLLEAAG